MARITYHCDECGEQVEEFCAAHPGARISSIRSRSGHHKHPRHLLTIVPTDYAVQRRAAEAAGVTWAAWAGEVLARAAKNELGK